jgi:hypothetical protein
MIMNDSRELCELTDDVVASEFEEGEIVRTQFRAGDDIFAALNEGLTRRVDGKSVPIVRFTSGLKTYWMPRSSFDSVAKRKVNDRTSTPFAK